eukprot:gene12824-26703_t
MPNAGATATKLLGACWSPGATVTAAANVQRPKDATTVRGRVAFSFARTTHCECCIASPAALLPRADGKVTVNGDSVATTVLDIDGCSGPTVHGKRPGRGSGRWTVCYSVNGSKLVVGGGGGGDNVPKRKSLTF